MQKASLSVIAATLGLISATPALAVDISFVTGSTGKELEFLKTEFDQFEKQTGNKVDLEVTPFPGMLAKARTAVRSAGKSPYDLINVNSPWTIEFYQGGFLEPLKEIDPAFEMPKEVYPFDDAGCWDAVKKFRTCKTGKLMGYAPTLALRSLFERTGTSRGDIGIIELNEAFASQAVAVIRDAGLDPEQVNPYGGAIALGHPVGATRANLTLRVAKDMVRRALELGVVTMCIGGGQALAALFRRV